MECKTKKWNELKDILAIMTEYIYNGFMFPRNTLHQFLEIRNRVMEEEDFESPHCPDCGACGVDGCCPPTTCIYGVNYINQLVQDKKWLEEDLEKTRKALGKYIEMMGFKATEQIIDQEIEFYGRD